MVWARDALSTQNQESGFGELSPEWRGSSLVVTASVLLITAEKRATLPAETEETP